MKQTDEALGKLIEKAIRVSEKTGNFVIEQAPDLLKEFYMWHIAQNVFGVLLGIILLFLSYKVIKVFGQDESDWNTDFELLGKHIGIGTGIISSCLSLFGIIFFFASLYQLVFILVAPKLFLIEYFVK